MIPVLCISGRSGSGKTTLIEQLLPVLTQRYGLRVGTIKHSHHQVMLDTPGKDSWRHKQAGAVVTVLATGQHCQWVMDRPSVEMTPQLLLEDMRGRVHLVLAEGFYHQKLSKIVFWTDGSDREAAAQDVIARISEQSDCPTDRPVLARHQIDQIAALIETWYQRQVKTAVCPVTAVILAGGQSRRMGKDKATLRWNKTTLLQSVITQIKPVCRQLLVSVQQPMAAIEETQICDREPHHGPLAGLISCLSQQHCEWAWVMACDMPFMTPNMIYHLFAWTKGCQAVVPVIDHQVQPLGAFYHISCLPILQQQYQQGERSIRRLLSRLNVCYVEEAQLRRLDPALHSFFDLDTPAQLQAAKELKGEYNG